MDKQRSNLQNRSIHKLFRELSILLNEHGLSLRTVLLKLPKIDCDWNEKMVKDILWRPIQKAILFREDGTPKKSTTEMTTAEVDKVFGNLNHAMSELGIHQPFPSIETIMQKMQDEEYAKK